MEEGAADRVRAMIARARSTWTSPRELWRKRRELWAERPRLTAIHRGVIGVLLIYVALSTLNVLMLPKYAPADEPRHIAYALLLQEGKWPLVTDKLPYAQLQTERLSSGNAVAAANHPPLWYWYVGPTLKSAADQQRMDDGVRTARFMNVLLGCFALLYAFRIARLFVPRHPAIALTATAFVGSLPLYVNTCALVYNDALGVLTCFATFHGALRLLVEPPTRWRIAIAGVWMALAMFTRISGLFIVGPALLLAFIALIWHGDGSWFRRVLKASLVCLGYVALIGAVSGWFYYRNYTLYGDVTASDAILKVFRRKPHGTTLELLLSERSWARMVQHLWVRLAGGVTIRGTVSRLVSVLVVLPTFASVVAAIRLRHHIPQLWRDKRLLGFLMALLALSCVILPMFMYHAKGGNLNVRYGLAIVWLPAMIFAVGLAITPTPAFMQLGALAYPLSAWLIFELYGRSLTKEAWADFAPVSAMKDNGVHAYYEVYLVVLLGFLVGLTLLVRAVGEAYRPIDDDAARPPSPPEVPPLPESAQAG